MSLDVGGGLAVEQVHGSNWQGLVAPSGMTVAAVKIDEQNSRCSLGMSLLDGVRIVDVSREPHVWLARLRATAFDSGEPRDRWTQAVAAALDRCGVSHAWWNERIDSAPAAVATAAAWPLLRPSVAQGFVPNGVPRWVARWCASPTLQHAVRAELAGRGTRAVTRSAGAHMAGPVAWWPIALMLALRQFDQGWTARILDQMDDHHCCDDFEFALLEATLSRSRPEHVLRLVVSVQDSGGPRRLLDGLENLNRIGPIRRLPPDIETLEQVVAASLPEQPAPRPVAQTRRAAARRPNRQRPRAIPNQPADNQVQAPREVLFNHPPHWRHLHRARSGEIDLLLPEGPAQLRRWGAALRNCLGGFDIAIAEQRLLILAVRHREIIRGAVSIDPANHRIQSIEAADNRPLPPAVVDVVRRILINGGAIRPT